jgi:class 3 adenylate cyclase
VKHFILFSLLSFLFLSQGMGAYPIDSYGNKDKDKDKNKNGAAEFANDGDVSDRDKIKQYLKLAKEKRHSDRKAAIEYAELSGQLAEKTKDYWQAYSAYYYLGKIHQDKKNILQPKAAIYAYERAAKNAERAGSKAGLMASYKKLAQEYANINQSEKSLLYYKKYSDLEEKKIEKKANEKADELSLSLEETQKKVARKDSEISSLETEKNATQNELGETLNLLDSVSKEKLFADLEIRNQELEIADQQLANERMRLTLADERNKRNILLGSVIGIALLLGFLLFAFFQNKRNTTKLAAKNMVIEQERNKSDELLLNILPVPVANELKEHGKTTPQSFENVTVLFTDVKSFTKISEQLSPIELVNEIDYCFRAFDSIISKYNIEKIKTIGDAYMCVSGLPVPYAKHCSEILRASIEIRDFILNLANERKKEGRPIFNMRLGVHSGPLVAGVVGSKKFVYDVWGDTVNTAARMEQNGEPGKINVSATIYENAKNEFNFTYRGKLEAKNKGELDMYFLNGLNSNVFDDKVEVTETTDISTS